MSIGGILTLSGLPILNITECLLFSHIKQGIQDKSILISRSYFEKVCSVKEMVIFSLVNSIVGQWCRQNDNWGGGPNIHICAFCLINFL